MTTPTNPAPESAGHAHTYNMAGVCVTCGHDADALATDHYFCENDDSPTRGATMVLDMLARIVTSDRDDADVGLMVRRVLNEPTLKAIRKAASAPAAPQPRETRCDPDVPHYYGLPATGCCNCFPPGSPDPYASTDDGKGASPESAGGETKRAGAIYAPFTPDQVRALNEWQRGCYVHPFTCGIDDCRADLVATVRGWICPFDDYTQTWAHEFMATPAAPQPETAERIVRDVFERRGVPIREDFLSETETCCTRPPKGWLCTRGAHPDGTPCAAVPDEATDYRLIEAWTHGHNAQCAADADDLERAKEQIAKCMERLDSLVDSSAQAGDGATLPPTSRRDRMPRGTTTRTLPVSTADRALSCQPEGVTERAEAHRLLDLVIDTKVRLWAGVPEDEEDALSRELERAEDAMRGTVLKIAETAAKNGGR